MCTVGWLPYVSTNTIHLRLIVTSLVTWLAYENSTINLILEPVLIELVADRTSCWILVTNLNLNSNINRILRRVRTILADIAYISCSFTTTVEVNVAEFACIELPLKTVVVVTNNLYVRDFLEDTYSVSQTWTLNENIVSTKKLKFWIAILIESTSLSVLISVAILINIKLIERAELNI